jgi:hypothetical protein
MTLSLKHDCIDWVIGRSDRRREQTARWPLRLALSRICAMLVLAALTMPLLASSNLNPWEQSDWQHWSRKDVDTILYNSPWVSTCCQPPVGDGNDVNAAIVSSQVMRQALARRMQLDKHYDTMSPTDRQQMDQKIVLCLNRKFDDQIVLTASYIWGVSEDSLSEPHPQSPWSPDTVSGGTSLTPHVTLYANKIPNDKYRKALSNSIYLVTSDGKNVFADDSEKSADSVALTCGGLTKDLDTYPKGLYGPVHELSFPRFVNGHPTIKPGDKVIRFRLNYSEGQQTFTIYKLVYQGKPDF